MRTIFLFLFYIAFAITNISSQEDILNKAGKEYNNGNFDKSITLYDSLLQDGYYSPDLYYNLGNFYYKKNDLGKAVLYYEKALKYRPNDADIKHNLYLTRRKIDSEIVELPDFFLRRWWVRTSDFFGLGIWTFLSIFFALILAVILGLNWIKNYRFNGYLPIINTLLILFFILSLFASFRKYDVLYDNDKCILIQADSLFKAPDNRSDLLYKLDPGEKLQLIDSINTWYKIKLVNKETGWIGKTNCKKI